METINVFLYQIYLNISMHVAVAEWVGVFLAVQQSGSGWAISEALLIGPEKKKRNICSLYDSVGNLKKIYNSTGDEAGDPVVLYHDVHGVHRVQVMV